MAFVYAQGNSGSGPKFATLQYVVGSDTLNFGINLLAFGPEAGPFTTVDTTNALPVSTELPDAAVLADTTANPTTTTIGSFVHGWNGATWDRLRSDTSFGLDVDVTRLPALSTGTNTIGKLAANTGVIIGDVNIVSLVPGTTSSSLGKLEDAPHSSGDTGVMPLAVRKDAGATLADTDGDYAPLQLDANGALRVSGGGGGTQYDEDTAHNSGDVGTLSLAVRRDANTSLVDTTGDYAPLQVDSSGNLKVNIIAGAGSGGTAIADNAAFTANSTNVTPMAAVLDNSSPNAATEDHAAALRMSANRSLFVNIRDAAGNERGLNVDASGNIGITDASGSLTVDGTVGVSSLPDATVVGKVAHDGVAAGAPVLLGGFAKATAPTDVSADADVAHLWCDLAGRLQVGDGGGSLTVDGTVAVSSVVAGTGATSLGKAEDASHTSGDTGVMALAVRNDAGGSLAGTDGDYVPLTCNSSGALYVTGGTSSTQYTEDAASAGAESLTLAGTVRRDTAASSSGTDGDYSTLNTDASGRLWVNGSGVTQPVSGTVTIGTSVTPGTGATNLGKAEDAGHTSGDTGVFVLAVRNDNGVALAGTDLDYIPLSTDQSGSLRVQGIGGFVFTYTEDTGSGGAEALYMSGTVRRDTAASSSGTDGDYSTLNTDATGRLWCNVSNTVTVSGTVTANAGSGNFTVVNGGTFAVQDSQVIADNAGFTDGTSKVFSAGFIFDEVAGTALTENDVGAARMDSKRSQVLVLEDATTRGQRAAVGSDGALLVNTEFPAAAALADATSNPTTPLDGACLMGWNGATWDRLRIQTIRKDLNAVSITSIATVWTPAGGKKFRLMGGCISVSAACNVLFEDNSGGNFVFRTPKLAADTPYNFDLGQGKLSATADQVLKCTASSAASITGTLYGTEE